VIVPLAIVIFCVVSAATRALKLASGVIEAGTVTGSGRTYPSGDGMVTAPGSAHGPTKVSHGNTSSEIRLLFVI